MVPNIADHAKVAGPAGYSRNRPPPALTTTREAVSAAAWTGTPPASSRLRCGCRPLAAQAGCNSPRRPRSAGGHGPQPRHEREPPFCTRLGGYRLMAFVAQIGMFWCAGAEPPKGGLVD